MPADPAWLLPLVPPVHPLSNFIPTELFPLLDILQAGCFLALLLAAAIIDCRRRVIPDCICALIAAAGLISFSSASSARLWGPLAALPLLIAAICKNGSMGGGDIKLTAASGLVLGFWYALWGMALGLALAVLFHCAKALIQKLRGEKLESIHQAALPLAPFLSVAFAVLYMTNLGGLL